METCNLPTAADYAMAEAGDARRLAAGLESRIKRLEERLDGWRPSPGHYPGRDPRIDPRPGDQVRAGRRGVIATCIALSDPPGWVICQNTMRDGTKGDQFLASLALWRHRLADGEVVFTAGGGK